jgi:K+-transporting ATPase KdpF subunit
MLIAAGGIGLFAGWVGRQLRRLDDGSGLCRADDRLVRRPGLRREGGGAPVSAANIAGLVLSAALTVFLVAALLFPERF